MANRQYIGARYVPYIAGEWERNKDYEPLTIVTFKGNSYTSKKRVPSGMPDPLSDLEAEYWAATGNYNAQVEDYRKEVALYINSGAYVTPEQYGAVGNGTNDDTDAVQNAVNSGKTVLFSKHYYVTKTITVLGSNSLISESDGWIETDRALEYLVYMDRKEQSSPQIFSVNLNGRQRCRQGLHIEWLPQLSIDNIETIDFTETHIYIKGGYGIFMHNVYCRNWITSSGNIRAIFNSATDSRFSEIVTVNFNIHIESDEQVFIVHAHPWNNQQNFIDNSVGVKLTSGGWINESQLDTCAVCLELGGYKEYWLNNNSFYFGTHELSSGKFLCFNILTQRNVYNRSAWFSAQNESYDIVADNRKNYLINYTCWDKYNNIVNNIPLPTRYYRSTVTTNESIDIESGESKIVYFDIPGIRPYDHITLSLPDINADNYKLDFKVSCKSLNVCQLIITNTTANMIKCRYLQIGLAVTESYGDVDYPTVIEPRL